MKKQVTDLAKHGVAGLIMLVDVHNSDKSSSMACATLSSLLGIGGMIGGAWLAGAIVDIEQGLATYGMAEMRDALIDALIEKGESKRSILAKLQRYPISTKRKERTREEVLRYKWSRMNEGGVVC